MCSRHQPLNKSYRPSKIQTNHTHNSHTENINMQDCKLEIEIEMNEYWPRKEDLC